MSLTQHFNLNIIPDSGPVVVHVDQYDHGEGRLVAHLYNGSAPYSPSGASAMIQGTKPDGNFYMYSCDIVGNTVTANLEEIMTQVCGRVRTQFVVTDGDNRTGTFVFELDVQSSALNGANGSESIIEYIEEAIEKATEEAVDSEAWAKGTRDNVPVESTDPTYHNNSKYFSEESSNFSVDSEAWANGTRGGTPVTIGDPTYENNSKYHSDQSEASAEDSEAWAVGERAGVPVTSGDPTYHNNSEYWAGVAEAAAEAAGGTIIANVEGVTSAHAYATGQQFIYDSKLYTATAPISVGGTITPGTNCTQSSNIVTQIGAKADLVDGKVPSGQLPSYVDDVIEGYYKVDDGKFYEEDTYVHEITPETGKIYVDLSTDISYRWAGSAYVSISNPDIAEAAVTTITASSATYPIPTAGDLLKVVIGKINKYLSDLRSDKVTANGGESGETIVTFTDAATDGTITTANPLKTIIALIKYKLNALKSDKLDASNIATVEETTTASKAYSEDDWLILGGQVYQVTTAIALGGTIVTTGAGANVTAKTVEELAASGGSGGGHTILNSSGTAMTQRGKLQFDGATVTDDSANDKTIVTTTPQSMIGDAWVVSHAYAVGDYCIDGNVLYKCKTAHTSSASNKPPYASYWDAVSAASAFASKNPVEHTIINSGWVLPSSFTWNNDGYYSYSTSPSSWPSQATFEKYSGYGKLFLQFLLADNSSGNILLNEVAPLYYESRYWATTRSLQGGVGQISAMIFGCAIYPYDGNLYLRISGSKTFIDAGINGRKVSVKVIGVEY